MYRCNALKTADAAYEYNNTKIQKLLYILYGFYWARRNLRLVGEQPKLWPHGPVFPRVFKYIQKNGFYSGDDTIFLEIQNADQELFDELIRDFGMFKAGTLSDWSHNEGSPWARTKLDVGDRWNTPINDDYIQTYFSGLNL